MKSSALNRVAIFVLAGKSPQRLTRSFAAIRQYTFPAGFFSSFDCAGRLLAVSSDYLSGLRPLDKLVLAKGHLLGKEVRLAIGSTVRNFNHVIIPEFEGHENLVARVDNLEIEQVVNVPPSTRPIIPPPPKTIAAGPRVIKPDFSFVPDDPPIQRGGNLSAKKNEYAAWLISQIALTWNFSDAHFQNLDHLPLIELAVFSLIRSTHARLDRLVAWGILTYDSVDAIKSLSKNISPDILTRMLIWFTAEHLALGGFSSAGLKEAVKQLVPYHYLSYLVEKYKDRGISQADAWYFASHTPNNAEQALIKTLDEAKRLAEKYQDEGVSEADAWNFALHTPGKAEQALIQALDETKRLAEKYKDQGISTADIWSFTANFSIDKAEKALIQALDAAKKLAEKYKDQGISQADAWRFASHTPNKSEQALIKALDAAKKLAEKYKDQGISQADALYFATHYTSDKTEQALIKALNEAKRLAEKYQDLGVSQADAWRFAANYTHDNAEKALIQALDEAKRLIEKYKDRGIYQSDAWYFATHYTSDKIEQALIKALNESKRLAEKYQDLGVSQAIAWHFTSNYSTDKAEPALIKALKEAKRLAEKYQDQKILLTDALYFTTYYNTDKAEQALMAKLNPYKT